MPPPPRVIAPRPTVSFPVQPDPDCPVVCHPRYRPLEERMTDALCYQHQTALTEFHRLHGTNPRVLLDTRYAEVFRTVNRSDFDLLDGWGRRFRYDVSEADYRLFSVGRDGVFNTIDDVPCTSAPST